MGMMKTITVNFGATPINQQTFTDTDAGLSGLTYAEAFVMRDSTADNNADAHEQLGSYARLTCSISGTTITIWTELLYGFVTGQFNLRYVAN